MQPEIESKTTVAPTPEKATRMRALTNQCFDTKKYEYDFSFKPADPNNFWEAHTTSEMAAVLENNPKIELESRILGVDGKSLKHRRMDSKSFLESYKKGNSSNSRFLEGVDGFSMSSGTGFQNGSIGHDFTPLLGGPFFKNLYYYQDYIRMHSECFYAYHYDPLAKFFVSITRDFVLGTGYQVQCDETDPMGKMAMVIWKAFEEVNDLQQQMDDAEAEISIYGENMFWWLPNNQTKIIYQLGPKDTYPTGIIPRVRLLDPSNMVEIVTYPEDITRKLFYVWLTPTQYQIYTSGLGSNQTDSAPNQPTLKYIYQQIPADQIEHFKVNSVSNEKRGRSDLFPILSYLKRLRDTVNYAVASAQKNAAWSIDTTVDGNQADIDEYIRSQIDLGTIPDAGSEFVHSKAVERNYRGNENIGGNMGDAFLYNLSLSCIGVQIPFSYLGTHLSGGSSTRAAAIVSTEPVAKKIEKRREVTKRKVTVFWNRLMKEAGLPRIACNVVFPEIITQDKSQKIQDLLLMQQSKWITPERAAKTAAKEMGMDDYDYKSEMETMQPQASPSQPLTGVPPLPTLPGLGSDPNDNPTVPPAPASGLPSDERKDIKANGTHL